MKEYFHIEKIRDRIHVITEPYFYEHANLYLIEGDDHDLLVDVGLGLSDIKSFLQAKGFNPIVVLTHAHFDHVGGIKHFLPSEIIVTAKVAKNLQHEELLGLQYLKPGYFDAVSTKELFGKTPQKICSDYRIEYKSLQALRSNTIHVGSYVFKIIPTPGHTNDSVVLYDKNHKLLLSGDTLYDGELYANFENSDKTQFVNSLSRLRSLDIAMTLTGHNQVLHGVQTHSVIERWLGELQQ